MSANASSADLESASLPYPQTPASAAAWFVRHGISQTAWARAHGLKRGIVVDLLRGKNKGRFGKSHEAAIALGLKPAPATVIAA